MRAVSATLLMMVACGGATAGANVTDAGPGGTNDGAITDATIGAFDGGVFVVRSASSIRTPTFVAVGLSSQSGTECGAVHGGAWALELYVFSLGEPFVPGTYPIAIADGGDPFFASASFAAYGPSCEAESANGAANSGTIVLTSIADRVVGSFDVTIGAVHLAGSFDAIACDADAGKSVGTLDHCQ